MAKEKCEHHLVMISLKTGHVICSNCKKRVKAKSEQAKKYVRIIKEMKATKK